MKQNIKTKALKISNKREKVRKSFTMSKEIADQWNEFSSQFPEKMNILETALTKFMEEYSSGNVETELDFGGDNDE